MSSVDVLLSHYIRMIRKEIKIINKLNLNVGTEFEEPHLSHEYVAQMLLVEYARSIFSSVSDHLRKANRHDWYQVPSDLPKGIQAIEEAKRLLKGSGFPYKSVITI